MPHKPFHLYKRSTTKNTKHIYYVQFYDDDGNRLTARSTGQTSKAAAETWSYEQLKRGLIATQKNITFGKYAENWWIWDKCEYVKGKIARGGELSMAYVDLMRAYLVNHILPCFNNKKLQKINTRIIENWIMILREKPSKTGHLLSHTTVNHCITCLKIMLNEAVRLEYLLKNPANSIIQLKENPKEKSILTIDEVKELFRDDNIDRVWNRDHQHYTINLLSASTGMRLGECQALQVQNVHDGYISVVLSWSPKYGLKAPKRNSQREIPVPRKTSFYLKNLISISPFSEPQDLVFFGYDRKIPIGGKIILKTLYRAFENIGISLEERESKNITFHSWRHFYNTLMRGKIHDAKLRRLTGHRTLEMTEHYTKFKLGDFKDVMKIQEQYFR
jgi:integrase